MSDQAEKYNILFSNIGTTTYERAQNFFSGPHDLTVNNRSQVLREGAYFRPVPVDTDTVILTIENLKGTKAVGSDGIPLRFLKDALPVIIPYITCINVTSPAMGIFLKAWKYAMVVPVFKSGEINSANNYRPISLLPIISKILKKIVANQLLHYLESKKLLTNSQHGSRPKLSSGTALTVITDEIYNNMDSKTVSLVALCDLSKAFDSVSHSIFLSKFTNLNIDSFWFKDYVSNMTQSARLNSTVSSIQNIAYGVPQGTILGPILSNIYVNNVADYITDCLHVQ